MLIQVIRSISRRCFPIVLNNKILIPAGSYVQGEILDSKRPGKVKGRGEMQIRLNTMILPNGYTVNFNAVPTNAGTGGDESVDKEGKIQGDTDKTTDAARSSREPQSARASAGSPRARAPEPELGRARVPRRDWLAVLLTRGPELELPRGTTLTSSSIERSISTRPTSPLPTQATPPPCLGRQTASRRAAAPRSRS